MTIAVVCGTNWGDEGKGRMIDYLARDADVVVRFQGGANAGHTVVNECGTFKMHLVPSGIFNPAVVNVLGPGVVVDLQVLAEELNDLSAAGFATDSVRVSDRATICFPFHRLEDEWEEERLGQHAFGSTRRGIAPAYGDRFLKKGIQVGELLHPDRLKERLRPLVEWKNLVAAGVHGRRDAIQYSEVLDHVFTYSEQIKDLICDTTVLLEEAAQRGQNILFEAQMGALRDVVYGIYPYTSSSCCLASFAPIGGGLVGHFPDRVIGVMKAFSTCVGAGSFATEMADEQAGHLREMAYEYGATTGRPRRIGHFDALASRYGAQIQGATEIALTKLDSLSGLDPLFLCTHYECNGRRVDRFPLNPVLDKAQPMYKEMQGWQEDISSCRHFGDLPSAARAYVLEIERLIGCRIRYVSVGPERHSLIDRAASD